jgi:hypothetical protein
MKKLSNFVASVVESYVKSMDAYGNALIRRNK